MRGEKEFFMKLWKEGPINYLRVHANSGTEHGIKNFLTLHILLILNSI